PSQCPDQQNHFFVVVFDVFHKNPLYSVYQRMDEKDIKMTAAAVMIEGNLSVCEVVFCSH
ncbi:MAG: hypothetical protein IKV65_01625, partial [Erysipelotrichaceae bacterium]|nr:hypothetical protein [Erysipelotrichaceae bacterium]